jgi:cell wall-associated NlpC family hydrolase
MNRVLRNVSGFKRHEGTGDWRRLHNVELHVLNMSANTTGVVRLTTRDLWAVWQVWGTGEVHRGFW